MSTSLETQQPLSVVYDPPGMGSTRVPNPIAGEGTLTILPDGLKVVGNKSRDVSFLALFAFLGSLALGIYFELDARFIAGIALSAIAAVFSVRLAGKKRIEVHYPWRTIRKVRYDELRKALVLLIKGAKPKGELFIRQPAGSALQREIEARRAQHGQ